jgi:class 3 adenylate cyclase
VFAQFWFTQAAFFAYLLGPFTDLMAPMALFVGSVALLAALGTRAAVGGIVTFFVLLIGASVAERWGLIPYAPAFVEAPYQAGRLSTFWFWWGVVGATGLATAVLVFVVTTQRLQRATTLIQRYVPAQLAERILSGEHTGAAQPERRKVTLFFSDVVGFTNSADRMEPEDLASLLNEYLGEMSMIADTFGATVNQFVGDGIMIFFGAPEATNDQDHAMRAVRMSLAMQQRMLELGEKWFAEGIQTPFRIRIGINTGVASVGDFGSEGRTTYSAIGNQTNLTARIQDHCVPGEVLISHTTWALVKDQIPCKERGEIEVKGLHYPVRVYEVVAEASHGGDA